MRRTALLLAVSVSAVFLAGCSDAGSDYAPRTHEFRLIVAAGSGSLIELYTMNDGNPMMVSAMGFERDGQDGLEVPNPAIRVKEGDTVILTVQNNNQLPHTLHLHGGLVPWDMDGVPFLTQPPIQPGESYTYVFEDMKAGTYFYHCHVDVAHHIDLGMYGSFIVEEVDPPFDADQDIVLMLDEWDNCHVHGNTEPITGAEETGHVVDRIECLLRVALDNLAQNQAFRLARDPLCTTNPPEPLYSELECGGHAPPPITQEPRSWYPTTHPVYDPEYNTFLLNGKAFPDTEPIIVQDGQTIRLRLINVGEQIHSMHIHGHNMLVTHRDGYELAAPFRVDTLGILPGERYDVFIELDNPGWWAFHDHVGLNVRNDLHAPGGMSTCIAYDGFHGIDAKAFTRALDCTEAAMSVFGGHG